MAKRRVPDAERREELAKERKARDGAALGTVFTNLANRLEYNLCKFTLTGDDLLELLVKPEDHIVVKRAREIGDIKSYYIGELGRVTNYPIPTEASLRVRDVYVSFLAFQAFGEDTPFLPVNYQWLNPDNTLPARVKLDEWVINKIMVEHNYQTLIWLNNQFGKMGMSYAQASFYFSSMRYLCEQAKISVGRSVPEDIPNITPEMRATCKLANQIVAQALLLPPVPEKVATGLTASGTFENLKYKLG